MRDPNCPQCSVAMERGYPLDHSHQKYGKPAQWVSGEPERSLWFGVKTGGRKKLAMVAYRCPRCGRVDLFAPDT